MKHTDLCYFHMQLTWWDWSRSRSWSRSFRSRSHNSFFWSRSRSRALCSRSWPWSHCVLVSLTSILRASYRVWPDCCRKTRTTWREAREQETRQEASCQRPYLKHRWSDVVVEPVTANHIINQVIIVKNKLATNRGRGRVVIISTTNCRFEGTSWK